jgi:tetratricopeptide (TPR) repeat protein
MKTFQCVILCWVCIQFSNVSISYASPEDDAAKKTDAAALAKSAEGKLSQARSPQDFQEAADILEQSVKLNRHDFMAQRTLGWIYLDKLHDPQTAYPHLVIAAEGQPQDLDSRKLLALACSQTGRTRKAASEFEQASLLKPDDLWIKANLGRSLAKLGRYDEANLIFADVLAKDPANIDARLGQAEVEAWHGRSAEALAILDQLIQENPQNVEALALRGDINRWNWRLTAARADYNQALGVVPDHYSATQGIIETERMGLSDIHASGYYFKDTTDFVRESVEGGVRVHLADKLYLLGRGAAWRFTNPGFEDKDRVDGFGGLEIDWARWLQTSVEAGVFDYRDGDSWAGGRAWLKLSPTRNVDLYAVASYRQPFVSSMATVINGLREDSIGVGADIRFNSRFSIQNALQLAKISDDNRWWEIKPQLSYRLFGVPDKYASFVRVEYDYLSYEEFRTDYWTPSARHVVSPILDICIPFSRHFQINATGKAPYVFDASKFGWQVEGGPTIDIANRVQLKGSAIYASIPEDKDTAPGVQRPPWSGYGGQVSLLIRF